jgi:hypothetical protein
MAKAITQKAKSIQQTPSNIPRMLANTANKRIPRVSNKNEREARFASGLYFLSRANLRYPGPVRWLPDSRGALLETAKRSKRKVAVSNYCLALR